MTDQKWVENIKEKRRYKDFVGVAERSDNIGALQFWALTNQGMRSFHTLLDIGCGCLRGGKLSIIYLDRGKYFAIEPNKWLVDEAITHEIGSGLIAIKDPSFDFNSDFNLSIFNRTFDYIMCDSVFIHASKKQILKCVSELKKVMHKKSIFIFTFTEGRDNEAEEWTYPGKVNYSRQFIINAFKGFKIEFMKWKYPGSQIWVKATI